MSETECKDCRTLIGGYVLGALEPDEEVEVRRHLETCAECAAEHADLARLPDLLTLAGGDDAVAERPPAALEEAVLDRFAREHPAAEPVAAEGPSAPVVRLRDRLRRPLPAAVGGAFAAAAAAVVIAFAVGGDEHYEAYHASLSGSAAAPAAHASARLETAKAGTRVALRVNGLRGNPDDVYELWCVRDDGTRVSAGTFRVDAQGRAAVQLTAAVVPGEYHRMSIERRGGAAAVSQRVMGGQIRYGES